MAIQPRGYQGQLLQLIRQSGAAPQRLLLQRKWRCALFKGIHISPQLPKPTSLVLASGVARTVRTHHALYVSTRRLEVPVQALVPHTSELTRAHLGVRPGERAAAGCVCTAPRGMHMLLMLLLMLHTVLLMSLIVRLVTRPFLQGAK